MKGRLHILITCVIVLSFTGIGYSAWTEGLNINSLFKTGTIQINFENLEVVKNELDEIDFEVNEGVLDIFGMAASDSTVLVEYDIYNGSSIPIKYSPDDEDLPEGIGLDQNVTVIKPGEYLRGNRLIVVPGENELILPFVQYNSKGEGGWKEELKICWNIEIAEEVIVPEDLLNETAELGEAPMEDVPVIERPTVDTPETDSTVTEMTPEASPEIDTKPETSSVTDPIPGTSPVTDPTPDVPAPTEPNNIGNIKEESGESEKSLETANESISESNDESNEGSEDNVNDITE